MLETLELDISFEDFENLGSWAPETENPMWDGLSSWLGEGSEVVWE